MISSTNTGDLFGATVRDRSGGKVGTVGQVFVDPDDAAPLWATVKTGLFGTHESFVPLDAAELRDGELVVPYDHHIVKDAPRIDTAGSLSEDETERLYQYYGVPADEDPIADTPTDTITGRHVATGDERIVATGADSSADADPAPAVGAHAGQASAGTAVGSDSAASTASAASAATTEDAAMTRSEEQLHVGTQRVASRRVRMQKVTITEMKTVTVPVSHEEIRLVEVPASEGDDALVGGTAPSAAAPSATAPGGTASAGGDAPHDVILTEERVVLTTERVPVERVRLTTDVVTENQEINETVRRERIELEQESGTDPVTPPSPDGDPASTGRES